MTGPQFILSADGLIATEDTPQNREIARRFLACVEACEGITTEELESGIIRDMRRVITEVIPLLQERNDLTTTHGQTQSVG